VQNDLPAAGVVRHRVALPCGRPDVLALRPDQLRHGSPILHPHLARRKLEFCWYVSEPVSIRLNGGAVPARSNQVGASGDLAWEKSHGRPERHPSPVLISFHASLEKDLPRRRSLRTRQERTAVFDYTEVFYNRERLHSRLAYRSPADYERNHEGGDCASGIDEEISIEEQARAA
jgi:hypothetical protein